MKIRKETKIGIIATIIIACFIWGYNFLKGKNILSTNNVYYAVYSDIAKLEEASPVYLSGFKVGVVESIKFHEKDKDKLVVKFSVQKDILIPQKSKAVIVSETVIAGKAIKLSFSNSAQNYLNGDTITGIVEKSITEELMPVKNKIENLLESMDSVLAIFDQERRSNLKSSLDNINKVTDDLTLLVDPHNSKLSHILANVESISANLKNNNEQISLILQNFSSVSDSLKSADLKATIKNANKTLAELSKISEKINKGEGTVGMLINNDSLYNNLNNLAANLDSLVIDLNKNPKRYVHFSLFGNKDK